MPVEDLYTKPGHMIRRCQQIAVAIFLEETAGFDVTPVQFAALFAVRESPGLEQVALARLIALDRSTIGTVVGRLEEKGLLTRRAAKEDRRVKLLYATEAGSALVADATAAVERAQARMLAPLEPAERKAFMRMLERIVDINNGHSRAPLGVAAD
jgi:DNA-binding MarR family transcriptional regulator